MRRGKLPYAATAILAACFFALPTHAKQTVLFDAEKDAQNVKPNGNAEFKIKDGAVLVSGKGRTGISIDGNWDISEFDALRFYFEPVKPSSQTLTICIENPNPDFTANTGFLTRETDIDGSENTEVRLKYGCEHNEVFDIVKDTNKMRATPFNIGNRQDTLDRAKVVRMRVYPRKGRGEFVWKLKKIVGVSAESAYPVPAWYKMTKAEFFPFIDKYGQFIHKDWPDKIRSDADLQKQRELEEKDLAANAGFADRDKWGGWENGPKLRATGHFRIEKIDGKWWMIDPDGRLYWSHGAVRVTPSSGITPLDGRKFFFKDLPAEDSELGQFYHTHDELLRPYYVKRDIKETYDFSAANIFRKYGKDWRNIYADVCHKRLKSWGLNTIANSSDNRIFMMDKTPYIDRFEIKSPELEGSEGYWWHFKDPFSPEFRANIRKNLQEREKQINDPWCIGIFVDNEINWGGQDSLAVWTLGSPETLAGKIVFVENLKNKYGEIENLNSVWGSKYTSWSDLLKSREKPAKGAYDDCVAFSDKIIEEYYKVISEEIKKAAPHLLYMGCRFAGIPKNPQVMYIGAKYCDVISFNVYRDTIEKLDLPAGIDKPIMIGEFHFGALDRGKFHPGLVWKKDQNERAQAYYDYVESALKNPKVIGTHWHQFSDQATTGRFDGENFQVGFTDVCDTPYWETIAKIREIGSKMYGTRYKK